MPLEGWSVPLVPRDGIEPSSEPGQSSAWTNQTAVTGLPGKYPDLPGILRREKYICRVRHGAGGGIQTPDILSTKQKLYQLSYTSRFEWAVWHPPTLAGRKNAFSDRGLNPVELPVGLEPTTYRLRCEHSTN